MHPEKNVHFIIKYSFRYGQQQMMFRGENERLQNSPLNEISLFNYMVIETKLCLFGEKYFTSKKLYDCNKVFRIPINNLNKKKFFHKFYPNLFITKP